MLRLKLRQLLLLWRYDRLRQGSRYAGRPRWHLLWVEELRRREGVQLVGFWQRLLVELWLRERRRRCIDG